MENSISERIVPNEIPYSLWQEHINRYAFAAEFVRAKNVLDVACGTGYGSAYLAESGAKEVVGGDISKEAITYALKNTRSDNLSFVLLNAAKLPFPNCTFDVITSFETIEHLERCRIFLAECKRTIKNGGFLVCSTPNKKRSSPHTKPLNPFHVREFYPMEYYRLLTSYFSDVTLYGQHFFSLKQRIRSKILGIGGKVISVVPEGNRIKAFINKSITCPSPNMSKIGTENSSGILDTKYSVVPFQDSIFKIPSYIIAVTKKSK